MPEPTHGLPALTAEAAWECATGGPWPEPEKLSGDEKYMAQAIREALAGIGLSSPNPSVGCMLASGGRVIGRGAHLRAGGHHAEVAAISDAKSRGEPLEGATAYVTLEPCCYTGRTPPCTDALAQAGIKRVVVGAKDLNPRVAGGGIAMLRASGIEVAEGVLGGACARLHAPFFKSVTTGLPWVMLKMALGSDGGIGPKGARAEVTPPEAQRQAHALRRACDGILAGRNTVAIDDPLLTDRWAGPGGGQIGQMPSMPQPPQMPHRVFRRIVLDSRGVLSPKSRVWQGAEGHSAMRVLTARAAPIEGVEDLRLPPGPGGCSLQHLLRELSLRGLTRLLVEGGPALASRLLEADLVDVAHIFRSDRPAGGPAVALDICRFGPPAATICFDGGRWEVLARDCICACGGAPGEAT